MSLGYPATSARSRGRWSTAALASSLWVALQVGQYLLLIKPNEHVGRVAVFERLIAAMALAGQSSEQVPDWIQPVVSSDSEEWIESIDEYAEAALEDGEFPPQAFADWALAHFLLGEKSRALELLERAEAEGISSDDPELRLVAGYLAGETPDTVLRIWAQDTYSQGMASWPVIHVISEMPSANIDRDWLESWLDEQGARMVRRGSIATAFLHLTGLLGLISIGVLFLGRRKIPAPLPVYRPPAAWDLALLTRVYFLGLLASAAGAILVWHSLAEVGLFTMGMVIAYLLGQLLPVLWMVSKLCPGCDAMTRLFGLFPSASRNLFPLRWAIVMAIAVAGGIIAFEELLMVIAPDFSWTAQPEDWLRLDMLDNHGRKAVGLLVAVLVAPFCEEILYRGFVFGALRRKIPPISAALVSSAIFATVHWYSLTGWCVVFLMGLLFCWLFQRTNSLWPGVLAHAIYNLAVVCYVQAWFSF